MDPADSPHPPPRPSGLPSNHWKADAVLWFVCWVLVACAGLSVAFVAVARGLAPHSEAWKIVANQLALQLPIVLGAHFFLGFHGMDWASGFGLRHVPRAWLIGIGAGLAAVLVGYPLQFAAAKAIEWLGGRPDAQEAVRIIARASSVERLLIATVAIAGAALAEEILFRGILYAAVRDAGFPRLALWGTAIFFGAIHANLAAFVPLALFGAVLALLYGRTGNLGACIAAHASFNVVGFLAAVFSGPGT